MHKRRQNNQSLVLAVLRRHGGPLSAYRILAELRSNHPKIAPPTVYRALDTLIKQGWIHRLESLNAYITCQLGEHHHTSILSICDDCGAVNESLAPELLAKLTQLVGKSGFTPTRHVLEVHGLCALCGTEQVSA